MAGDISEEVECGDQRSIKLSINVHIPERQRVAEILCNQPDDLSAKDLVRRRTEVVTLMAVLCDKRETAKRKAIRKAASPVQTNVVVKEESPAPDQFPLLMDKTQCPCCIGSRAMLNEERTFRYCRPAVMNDHFDREHLEPMEEAEQQNLITCQHLKCQENGQSLKLVSLDHFRTHVQTVHGVWLRPDRKWRNA